MPYDLAMKFIVLITATLLLFMPSVTMAAADSGGFASSIGAHGAISGSVSNLKAECEALDDCAHQTEHSGANCGVLGSGPRPALTSKTSNALDLFAGKKKLVDEILKPPRA